MPQVTKTLPLAGTRVSNSCLRMAAGGDLLIVGAGTLGTRMVLGRQILAFQHCLPVALPVLCSLRPATVNFMRKCIRNDIARAGR